MRPFMLNVHVQNELTRNQKIIWYSQQCGLSGITRSRSYLRRVDVGWACGNRFFCDFGAWCLRSKLNHPMFGVIHEYSEME